MMHTWPHVPANAVPSLSLGYARIPTHCHHTPATPLSPLVVSTCPVPVELRLHLINPRQAAQGEHLFLPMRHLCRLPQQLPVRFLPGLSRSSSHPLLTVRTAPHSRFSVFVTSTKLHAVCHCTLLARPLPHRGHGVLFFTAFDDSQIYTNAPTYSCATCFLPPLATITAFETPQHETRWLTRTTSVGPDSSELHTIPRK